MDTVASARNQPLAWFLCVATRIADEENHRKRTDIETERREKKSQWGKKY